MIDQLDTTASPDFSAIPLREHARTAIRRYLEDLNGIDVDSLYRIALAELEIPLFSEVMQHCNGNLSRAANMLGIHRATLRTKLQHYKISYH